MTRSVINMSNVSGTVATAQTIRLRPYIYMEGSATGTAAFGDSSLFIMEIAQ